MTSDHTSYQDLASPRRGSDEYRQGRAEAGGDVPTIPLLDRISAALDADLIVEIAPHAA
jgi:hypothetical protein